MTNTSHVGFGYVERGAGLGVEEPESTEGDSARSIYFSFFPAKPTCPHAASSLAPLLSLSIVAAADRSQGQSPVTYDLAGVSPSATGSRERSRKASPPFSFDP